MICGSAKCDTYINTINDPTHIHTKIRKPFLNPCAESFVSKGEIDWKFNMEEVSVKKLFALNPLAKTFVPLSSKITPISTPTFSEIQHLYPCAATFYPEHLNEPFRVQTNHFSEIPFLQSVHNISLPTNLTLNPLATVFVPELFYGNNRISLEDNIATSPENILNNLRIQNLNRIIVGHININSIRNKFEMLSTLVRDKVDILLISESKLNDTFPTSQFRINGFSPPFRKDRSEHGGGVLLYTRGDIPSRQLQVKSHGDIECIAVEVIIAKTKWFICGSYNPQKSLILSHLSTLSSILENYMPLYDNFIILGDFNSEITENSMSDFSELFNLHNLIKEPTCYKNPENPSCIDLILTNQKHYFQNTKVVETGLSDFHKMTLTVLKTTFRKKPPKVITYRNYKNYSQIKFRNELEYTLEQINIATISNDEFVNLFMTIFNKHAPLKLKYVRSNDSPFMTKELRKEIMVRSKFRNNYHNKNTFSCKLAYKIQRNKCTSLLKKIKREYYKNLNPSSIADNKKFWKTVKPFFTDKVTTSDNIILLENNIIYDDEKAVCDIFSDFFSNVVKNLNIVLDEDICNNNVHEVDPVLKAIKKYKNHPSIQKINEQNLEDIFSFQPTTSELVTGEIFSLNTSKATPKDSIPTKILKENYDIFGYKLATDFNWAINNGSFPENQKYADISPIFKKDNNLDKSNYRPVSILVSLSKIFERLLFYQINAFMDPKLSIYQCGFRKNMNAQNCLLVMLEKWRHCLDNGGSTGVLLTDLSKAFDCLIHDLLIAKLHAYGFDYNALKLIHNYITGRYQRVAVNSTYSSWTEIIYGVPQGSILGPLLFNIYIRDLFMFTEGRNTANYADDNSPYVCSTDIDSVISELEYDSDILLDWVSNNGLKANPNKFHLILNDHDDKHFIKIENRKIYNSTSEKLLGIKIDNKLSFNEHVTELCRKASQKLHALSRISRFMNISQRKVIMKAFIHSQFGYCPLVWMFHSRKLNNRINKIQERSLRIVYNDQTSTFRQLLRKDNSFTIHERNIQILGIELYKILNGLSPEIMKMVFPIKDSKKYSSSNMFITRNVHTVKYGTETISHLTPKIWAIIPSEIKKETTLKGFSRKIKQWQPQKCPCRLCKTYIDGVGYID